MLTRAIKKAKRSKHASKLAKQIQVCEKLRDHLREISKYSHDILDIEQTTISEIRSYDHPPERIFQVMASVYRLLGYQHEKVQVGACVFNIIFIYERYTSTCRTFGLVLFVECREGRNMLFNNASNTFQNYGH